MAISKRVLVNLLLLGFFSWAIPFAVSLLFYGRNGELNVPYSTFKSIITAVGAITGCYFLFRYFKSIDQDFVRNGITVGICWMVINLILDAVVLIPMMKTTIIDYLTSIGISYLSIPAISIAMGYILKQKTDLFQHENGNVLQKKIKATN